MDSTLNAIIVKVQKELYAQYGCECAALTNKVRAINEACKGMTYAQKKMVLMSSASQIVAQYGN